MAILSSQTQIDRQVEIQVRIEPIDAALHDRLARRYWDWRVLYETDECANPWQHPDVVLSQIQHVQSPKITPAILVAVHDENVVGLGALVPKTVKSGRLGSIGISSTWVGLRLAGNGWLLRHADHAVETALTLEALQYVRNSGARFLLIEDLEVNTALEKKIHELGADWLKYHHAGIQPRWRIELPTTRDAYWQRFSKKTLSTMRRKLKKFGNTRLERITAIDQIPHFLQVAHTVSLQTWQTRRFGLRIRNDAAECYLFTQLAQHGLLRSYLWYSDDQPVAFLIGLQDKGRFLYEEVGYATPYARFSPGQMLLIQVLDDLFLHNRPQWFDFGGGDADYKQFFSNHQSLSGTVWMFPRTFENRLKVNYLQACLQARRLARRALSAGGWTQYARQWIRYAGTRMGNSRSTNATTH